jgi:hypothetical protein
MFAKIRVGRRATNSLLVLFVREPFDFVMADTMTEVSLAQNSLKKRTSFKDYSTVLPNHILIKKFYTGFGPDDGLTEVKSTLALAPFY